MLIYRRLIWSISDHHHSPVFRLTTLWPTKRKRKNLEEQSNCLSSYRGVMGAESLTPTFTFIRLSMCRQSLLIDGILHLLSRMWGAQVFISPFWAPFLQNESNTYLAGMFSGGQNMDFKPGKPGFDIDFLRVTRHGHLTCSTCFFLCKTTVATNACRLGRCDKRERSQVWLLVTWQLLDRF